MINVTRYAVIETALCIGSNLMEGEVFMVMATDHDRELAALREELAFFPNPTPITKAGTPASIRSRR